MLAVIENALEVDEIGGGRKFILPQPFTHQIKIINDRRVGAGSIRPTRERYLLFFNEK